MSAKNDSKTRKSPKLLKSYLARIKDATDSRPLASFSAFPRKVSFDSQDRGEHIVLLVRQHPAVLIPSILKVLGVFIVPFLVVPLIGGSDIEFTFSDFSFSMGLIVLWVMLMITISVTDFLKWFFSVNIITNERIVDIDFNHFLYHKVSETQLERVEDVSHSPLGVWATLFDYGTVYIQTAGESREFEFNNVPRPRDVQDTLLDLLELKQSDG